MHIETNLEHSGLRRIAKKLIFFFLNSIQQVFSAQIRSFKENYCWAAAFIQVFIYLRFFEKCRTFCWVFCLIFATLLGFLNCGWNLYFPLPGRIQGRLWQAHIPPGEKGDGQQPGFLLNPLWSCQEVPDLIPMMTDPDKSSWRWRLWQIFWHS